jgi:hypothetical protein
MASSVISNRLYWRATVRIVKRANRTVNPPQITMTWGDDGASIQTPPATTSPAPLRQ